MSRRIRSIYADVYVKGSHRAKRTPRTDRPWRPRVLAWAGPTAFNRNRFYELDKWYKARITRPELIPQLHIIEPDDFAHSLAHRRLLEKQQVERIDIGFKERSANPIPTRVERSQLEKLSRTGKCQLILPWQNRNQFAVWIDLDVDDGAGQLSLLDHYHIFDDLFLPGVFFHSTVSMDLDYDGHGVYSGNLLLPSDTRNAPRVSLVDCEKSESAFFTLLMVDLDGTGDGEGERVHWLAANWSDDPEQGDLIVPYLQPVPFHGTGFHRVVFLLFRHETRLDFSVYRLKNDDFDSRVFHTARFYKTMEDAMTPCALRFFQTQWDASCAETMRQLGLPQPTYEYEWNEPRKPPQREFPNKPQPFDLYLDQYRDPDEVNASLLKERLRMTSPFRGPSPSPVFPDIAWREHRMRLPTWQHDRLVRRNRREGPAIALEKNEI